MKRRWPLLLILGTAVIATGVFVWLLWPTSRLAGNFHRIKVGMTHAEVEDVLGEPSENGMPTFHFMESRRLIAKTGFDDRTNGDWGVETAWVHWYDDSYIVGVRFDDEDKVIAAFCYDRETRSNVFDWVRAQLGI
jgi:hypothetical protein